MKALNLHNIKTLLQIPNNPTIDSRGFYTTLARILTTLIGILKSVLKKRNCSGEHKWVPNQELLISPFKSKPEKEPQNLTLQ